MRRLVSTLKDVARIPTLRTGLLDVAAGIGIAGPAAMVLSSFAHRPPWITATITLLLLTAVGIWVLWRRSAQRSRTAAIAFAIVAATTMALGNGSLFYGIVWTACLIMGVTFARTVVLWTYAGALVVLVLLLHLSAGSGPQTLSAEAIATGFLAGLAAAVSVVLRDALRVGDALHDANARLDAANAELRRRLDSDRDLVLAQERERTARDLHDDLGHRLTAIGLSLDYVLRTGDESAAREELMHVRALITESLDAMRLLVRAMHPVELGSTRDADAFRAIAHAFRGTGLHITVEVDDEDALLDHAHALFLLRFVQEGLTNVVRHSSSTTAALRITAHCGALDASLEDHGAPTNHEPIVDGFGLRSLRARAAALHGALEASHTADGFRIRAVLPLRASAVSTTGAS